MQHTAHQNPSRGPSSFRNVQRQDSLDRLVHGGHMERLKHGLRQALSVGLGVQRNVRDQNGIFFRCNPEFVVEREMQYFLHVVTRRKGAQYLYPALGWRLRNHHGGRGRPRRSPARVRSEAATPRRARNAHLSPKCFEFFNLATDPFPTLFFVFCLADCQPQFS